MKWTLKFNLESKRQTFCLFSDKGGVKTMLCLNWPNCPSSGHLEPKWQTFSTNPDYFFCGSTQDRCIPNFMLCKTCFGGWIFKKKRISWSNLLCRNRTRSKKLPYHYYNPRGSDECMTYIQNQNNQKGGHHRFITEKQVFGRWAHQYNITFAHPTWWDSFLEENGCSDMGWRPLSGISSRWEEEKKTDTDTPNVFQRFLVVAVCVCFFFLNKFAVFVPFMYWSLGLLICYIGNFPWE